MGSDISFETILFQTYDHIAVITLNRPEVLNAVNSQLCEEAGRALEFIAKDTNIRDVIITGAGSTSFCAGADLKAVAAGEFGSGEQVGRWGFAGICNHYIDKPIIAAVNGFALGGGTEIALAADIVVASESASFGLPEVTRGLIAGAGGILRLSRQIPTKIAARMIFEGKKISSQEAAEWGLVNIVVPSGQVLEKAIQIAKKIAANSPVAVRMSKDVFYRGLDAPLDFPPTARDLNNEYVSKILLTEDAAEGARAFAEKRKPNWTDS